MKKHFLILILSVLSTLGFAQIKSTTSSGNKVILHENFTWEYDESKSTFENTYIKGLEIPETPSCRCLDVTVEHNGFTIFYSERYEQPSWAAYVLTRNKVATKSVERTDKFLVDPKIATGTANDDDYRGSGYDRGHIVPAADMGYSETTMAESFLYDNVSPQKPGFNRGIWKDLESLIRFWSFLDDTIYIATGPVLKGEKLQTIGANNVGVPKYFYKVILDYSGSEHKGIGFILPNDSSSLPLQNFVVSVDSVESMTGIDFFPKLPDEEENKIESTTCISCWEWNVPKYKTRINLTK